MIRKALPIVALVLCSTLVAFSQKKPAPRSVRFQGAPQYTQDDLLAATRLKPGARMTPADVKSGAKALNDTGLFSVVKFTTDSKGPVFTLTPVPQLYPMHIDNLPIKPGKDLDDKLHAQFPLYRGQLPPSGSMDDGICRMLEGLLAAQNLKATVKATLTSGLGPQKVTAVDFSIASPPVHIGNLQLSGVSPAMQSAVSGVVSSQSGNGFDTENSGPGLKRAFEEIYQDQGYAAVQVDVKEIDPPVASNQAIEIPFAITIKEGGVYKLGSITYPSSALVPRSEVDKTASKYPAKSGRPLDLFLLAVRDAYHAHGYLDCVVTPHANFSEATHIVNYAVEIEPGSAYKMGTVTFDGAPDAMATRLNHAWKLPAGSDFNEAYVSTFSAQAQKQDKTLAKWLQSMVTTFDVKPDADAHRVNCVFHFAKAA